MKKKKNFNNDFSKLFGLRIELINLYQCMGDLSDHELKRINSTNSLKLLQMELKLIRSKHNRNSSYYDNEFHSNKHGDDSTNRSVRAINTRMRD